MRSPTKPSRTDHASGCSAESRSRPLLQAKLLGVQPRTSAVNPNVSQRGRVAAKSSFEPATEAGQDPEIIVRTFIGGLAGCPRPGGSDFWSEKDAPFPRLVVQRSWSRYFLPLS